MEIARVNAAQCGGEWNKQVKVYFYFGYCSPFQRSMWPMCERQEEQNTETYYLRSFASSDGGISRY